MEAVPVVSCVFIENCLEEILEEIRVLLININASIQKNMSHGD